MTLTGSALFLLLALTMMIGAMLGYWFRDGAELWRTRLEAESAKYRRYRAEAETVSAQHRARIAQLEAAYSAETGRPAPLEPGAVINAEAAPAPMPALAPAADLAADLATADADATAGSLAGAASAAAEQAHSAVLSAVHGTKQFGAAASAPAAAIGGGMMAAAASAFAASDQALDPAPAAPTALMADLPAPAPEEAAIPPADPLQDTVPDTVFIGDDLTRIRGIDDDLASNLQALGVHRFSDIETMSAIDELALEQRLKLPAGFITAEQWRLQAALLAADVARAQGIGRELPSDA